MHYFSSWICVCVPTHTSPISSIPVLKKQEIPYCKYHKPKAEAAMAEEQPPPPPPTVTGTPTTGNVPPSATVEIGRGSFLSLRTAVIPSSRQKTCPAIHFHLCWRSGVRSFGFVSDPTGTRTKSKAPSRWTQQSPRDRPVGPRSKRSMVVERVPYSQKLET